MIRIDEHFQPNPFAGPDQSIGRVMNDLRLEKKPVNVLRRKIMAFKHSSSHVMRLMTLIASMVSFSPVDRVDMQEVMTFVADVQHSGEIYCISVLLISKYQPVSQAFTTYSSQFPDPVETNSSPDCVFLFVSMSVSFANFTHLLRQTLYCDNRICLKANYQSTKSTFATIQFGALKP